MGPRVYRNQGGFTLIEMLVVIALVAVLAGVFLPAVQKVETIAGQLAQQPQLAPFAQYVRTVSAETAGAARAFLLRLADRGAEGQVVLDDLKPFCGADVEFGKASSYLAELIASTERPAVQHRLLLHLQGSVDAELLPAVQRVATVLHTRVEGFCPAR